MPNLLATIQDDVGLARQLLLTMDREVSPKVTELTAHLMNKYSDLYDTRQLWTRDLIKSTLEQIVSKGVDE